MTSSQMRVSRSLGLVLAGGLVLVGGGLAWAHRHAKAATAASVLEEWVSALRGGDLPRAASLTDKALHYGLVRDLCEPRYRRAKHIYDDVIPSLALPGWTDIRRRAEGVAIVEAMRLRAAIETAGREAIGRLPPDQMQALTSRPSMYEQFMVCSGYAAISDVDREKIDEPMAFWRASGRLSAWSGADPLEDSFIVRAAWPQMNSQDQVVLGTRDALAANVTVAKLECFDRIGKPLLGPRYRDVPAEAGFSLPGDWVLTNCLVSFETPPAVAGQPARREQVQPDLRPEIEGIERADVADIETFVARHGETIAGQALRDAEIGAAARPIEERHPLLLQGSLLRRTEAEARATVVVRGAPINVLATEIRQGGAWQIIEASPGFLAALTEVKR